MVINSLCITLISLRCDVVYTYTNTPHIQNVCIYVKFVKSCCNDAVHEDFSEVKCAKVIHDMLDKLHGLCRARDGLRQYRYR